METSFFSGSENLYKYLVTIGILLVVLTIYYPLREKQELEILKIELENELQILNYKILQNKKDLDHYKASASNVQKSIVKDSPSINYIKETHSQNELNNIAVTNKLGELQVRKSYIKTYGIIFWLCLPIGTTLVIFGFFKWHRIKVLDDEILALEKRKLEIEVTNLENSSNP